MDRLTGTKSQISSQRGLQAYAIKYDICWIEVFAKCKGGGFDSVGFDGAELHQVFAYALVQLQT